MCVRRLPGRRRRHMTVSAKGSKGSAKVTTKEIREWAIGEGREVSLRGRISAELEQAFHDAQTKKVPTKTAPVKKTAAKQAAAPKAAVKRTAVSKPPAKKSSREIREWAIGEGREVSLRGRIPAEVEQAFHDAQTKKVPTKTAPVKKAAAKKTAATKTAVKKTPATKMAGKKTAATKTAAKNTAKKIVATKAVAEKKAVKRVVAAVSKAPAKKSSREIREWAIGAGHEVSLRGRIPAEVEQAFHDAQTKKVPTKTAAVKKTAAKKATVRNTAAATAPATRAAARTAPATKTAATKTAEKKTIATRAAAEKKAVKKMVAVKVPVKRTAVSKAPAKKSSREIREWAIGAGHEVSLRGRISAELERAFHDAQAQMPVA
ncbi:hypothetical protein C5613_37570 [Rhodococcus opacus]|uniref:Lsr2 DNA-binding domain-containing protein n=2 Tax=Rhodococcus opacus TaxID=37919 RepID=A0A2S8IMA7_RHOOP|nr:hypothetical protein C5613_37570 [Rhodococcus opacus]